MTQGGAPTNDALLALAVDIAAEAAALVARFARDGYAISTKSTRTDMVTEADRAAEELITRRILAARPDDGLLGEEGAFRPGRSGHRWVVDPIDGTTNFIYGIPAYCVSIAVERDGVVVAGVVHDVAHGLSYTATLGGGAACNGSPIHAGQESSLETALFGTGFAYDPARRAEQARLIAAVIPSVRDIRRMGSSALDLAHVACGMLDGYFEYQLQPWDIAAGGLILREAGGVTTGLGGRTFDEGFVLACGPHLLAPASALLERAIGPLWASRA